MDLTSRLTIIITAGVLVSLAGIYHEAVNRSDLIGAGLFFMQGALFLLYYFLRTRKPPRRHTQPNSDSYIKVFSERFCTGYPVFNTIDSV